VNNILQSPFTEYDIGRSAESPKRFVTIRNGHGAIDNIALVVSVRPLSGNVAARAERRVSVIFDVDINTRQLQHTHRVLLYEHTVWSDNCYQT